MALIIREAEEWLKAYGLAWEKGDSVGIGALFAEDAIYREAPFDPPMTGRAAIQQYWQEGAGDGQESVTFGFEVWAVSGHACIAHWTASFVRKPSGHSVLLDGVFKLEFRRGAEGAIECTALSEWWQRQE